MTDVLQTLGAVLLAAVAVGLGWAFSRLKSRAWIVGYLLPLAVIVLIVLGRRVPRLTLQWPWSWLMAGRVEFALFGAATAMVLTTPLSRMKSRQLKLLVICFIAVFVTASSVMPFLQPLLLRRRFAALRTRVDARGICLQSTPYTCGPAAAVTALRRLGLDADEGDLAIASHTTTVAGTPADVLCTVLNQRYGPQGLVCEYRGFRSIGELRAAGLVLAEVNLTIYFDHWVAVLAVTDNGILLGDPATGLRTVPPDDFARIWRFTAITMARTLPRE